MKIARIEDPHRDAGWRALSPLAACPGELFAGAPVIANGELISPAGPGWGVGVNEAAIRAHPPTNC